MERKIKTEKEFKLQFGPRWRNDVAASWNTEMDYMLDTPLRNLEYREYRSARGNFRAAIYEDDYFGGRAESWTLSQDMVKELNSDEKEINN